MILLTLFLVAVSAAILAADSAAARAAAVPRRTDGNTAVGTPTSIPQDTSTRDPRTPSATRETGRAQGLSRSRRGGR